MTDQTSPKSLPFYIAIIIAAVILLSFTARACRRDPTSALKGQTNITMPFYGKVVDQDGEPLPGATFEFRLDAYSKDWTFDTRGRDYDAATLRATSDARGLFELKLTGCMLRVIKASRAGYRYLEELDSADGSISFTHSIRLISWSDAQYKSDPDRPAVYVFVKDGCDEATALPCQGGFRRYGNQWVENKSAWPRKPSLDDVEWKHGQPRINVSVPLVFKVVDTEGKPIPNAKLSLTVERYLSPDQIRRERREKFPRKTSKVPMETRTGPDGLARVTAEGFRLTEVKARLGGVAPDTGPSMVNEIINEIVQDYYFREFMDVTGQVIYRCDDSNPMVIVMVDPGTTISHVMPSRGGYEFSAGRWQPVEPEWPPNQNRKVNFRGDLTPRPNQP